VAAKKGKNFTTKAEEEEFHHKGTKVAQRATKKTENRNQRSEDRKGTKDSAPVRGRLCSLRVLLF
jgi:hypothetical protein